MRPALGLSYLDGAQARAIGFVSARRGGVLVLDVPEVSPAYKAGIRGTLRLKQPPPAAAAATATAATAASADSAASATAAALSSFSNSSSIASSSAPPAAASNSTELQRALGLQQLGDVIQSIDGRRIKTEKDLFQALDKKKVGDQITVQVLRTDILPDMLFDNATDRPPDAVTVEGSLLATAATEAEADSANNNNNATEEVVSGEDLFALGRQRVATLIERGLSRYTVEFQVVLGEKPESPLSSGIGLGRELDGGGGGVGGGGGGGGLPTAPDTAPAPPMVPTRQQSPGPPLLKPIIFEV